MLTFTCILSTILELVLTTICVLKLVELNKKIKVLNEKVIIFKDKFNKTFAQIRATIKKINKVMSILTDKRIWLIKKYIFYTVDIIQIIMLLKSIDFSKGIKSFDFKTIKKLLLAQVSKELIRKFFNFFAVCA